MATYVFSDVHGHAAPLERLLWRVSPAQDDHIYMLGDMIDRGPDPVGVLKCCQSLAQAGDVVLMGNHEDLMLAYMRNPDDYENQYNWLLNGGLTTLEGLDSLKTSERSDLISWVESLPLSAYTRVDDVLYVFTHAGLNPLQLDLEAIRSAPDDQSRIEEILRKQTKDDLLWIREPFWNHPTGLIDDEGCGTVVICGHTPTPYLDDMADRPDRSGKNAAGLGQMVKVGACKATADVADRWDIDAGCAGGHGFGRLLLVRLDDGMEFYEDIEEGE